MAHASGCRRWFPVLALTLLSGCGERLPSCVATPGAAAATPASPAARQVASERKNASELLVGIDGSGSMLGLTKPAAPSPWASLLQAVTLVASTEGLPIRAVRVGGGNVQPIAKGSVTAASNPCFFQGCGGYQPVASSLQALWTMPTPKGETPLRLIVSDLEVNQSDISSLVGAIKKDLAQGAGVGVLGLKLPFEGNVYNSASRVIFTGRVNRPIYLLATGKPDQVRQLLEGIRRTLGLKGVQVEQQLSLLDPGDSTKTLLARSILGRPVAAAASGLPLRLGGTTYSPSNNPDYQFVSLRAKARGIDVATSKGMTGGTRRPDLGLVRIEAIPLAPGDSTNLGGVRLESITIAGSNLLAELSIDRSIPSGLLRATVPRGALPQQWWLDWDRSNPGAAPARQQSDGLLLLMTTLGQQVQQDSSSPAVALCVAFQRS